MRFLQPHSSPSASAFFACAMRSLHCAVWTRTIASTRGFIAIYCALVEIVAGPEMMSGVRASSMRIESTSSTIAKWCPFCTTCSGACAMPLSRR